MEPALDKVRVVPVATQLSMSFTMVPISFTMHEQLTPDSLQRACVVASSREVWSVPHMSLTHVFGTTSKELVVSLPSVVATPDALKVTVPETL